MPAYVLVRAVVHDPEAFKAYQAGTPASLAEYGGRFLVRGGPVETLEGPEETRRVVVVAFPDAATARAWYASPGYQALIARRAGNASFEMVLVEGAAPAPPAGG